MAGSARGIELDTHVRKTASLLNVVDESWGDVEGLAENLFKNTPEGRVKAAQLVRDIRANNGYPRVEYIMKAF